MNGTHAQLLRLHCSRNALNQFDNTALWRRMILFCKPTSSETLVYSECKLKILYAIFCSGILIKKVLSNDYFII